MMRRRMPSLPLRLTPMRRLACPSKASSPQRPCGFLYSYAAKPSRWHGSREVVRKSRGGHNRQPDGFGDQPKVVNGLSDLMVEGFGEAIGKHARSPVGAGGPCVMEEGQYHPTSQT
jgi:hypothetical protein